MPTAHLMIYHIFVTVDKKIRNITKINMPESSIF